MNPEFKDETPLNPFDFWTGANFKIKIRQVEVYANYDKSEFAEPSALYDGDDKKCEEVWNQQHSLKEFVSPDNFKSYQELEARFNTVIAKQGDEFAGTIEESTDEPVTAGDKGDDSLEYFKKLAEQ